MKPLLLSLASVSILAAQADCSTSPFGRNYSGITLA